jgi:hypothetical protein
VDSAAGLVRGKLIFLPSVLSRKYAENSRSGAKRRRSGLVHHDELGSEQCLHGAFPTEVSISQTVRDPPRRQRIVEPDSDRSESGKELF